MRELRCEYEVLRNKSKAESQGRNRPSKTERSRPTKLPKANQPRENSSPDRQRRKVTEETKPSSTASHERLKPGRRHPSNRLVDVDVKADGARVEVLEVVETGVANGLHLDGDGLAGAARSVVDVVRVAGSQLLVGENLVSLGLGLVSGALDTGGLQDAELDLAGAGEREGRGLKLGQFGEEELERAGLALVGSRDVEVEDRADGSGGGAVERGVVALLGLGGVDGDDQVRELGWKC